jgi:hypothetical protein
MSFFLRDEGRAATNCLKPLLNECKELADDDLYQVFTVIDTMGGCEKPESPGMLPKFTRKESIHFVLFILFS